MPGRSFGLFMTEVLNPTTPLGRTSPAIGDSGCLGKRGVSLFQVFLMIASPRIDDVNGRPILTRRSLSLRRQSWNAEKSSPSSYFHSAHNHSVSSSDGLTPPPPYRSPVIDNDKEEDKHWIELLEHQNNELMERITTLSKQATLATTVPRKGRPTSFHGHSQIGKEQPTNLQSILTSNLIVQKQLSTMREELDKTRRRCAELSEVEARKKGLELRCIGLERVVEELMSAIDVMKTHSSEKNFKRDEWSGMRNSRDEPKGLAIYIEDCGLGVNVQTPIDLRESFDKFVVSTRRKLIPYRLRAVILFLLSRLRDFDCIDQVLGAGIIVMGTILWATFLLGERGRTILNSRGWKKGMAVETL